MKFTSKTALIALSLILTFSAVSGPADDLIMEAVTAPEADYTLSAQDLKEILSKHLHYIPSGKISRLAGYLQSLCLQYHFDPAFVLSVIEVESHFKPQAVSGAGAVGLMQVMPATARVILESMSPAYPRFLGLDEKTLQSAKFHRKALMDPFVNLTLGVAYLASLRDRYAGMHPYVLLAAYNLGPARLDELMSRKDFKPAKTMKYFEAIREGTYRYRTYHRPA